MRQDATGVTDQQRQERPLGRRELHLLAVPLNGSGDQIDYEPVLREKGALLARLSTALGSTQAGKEFSGAERLRDIIVGTRIERSHFVLLVITNREDKDRRLAPLAEAAQHGNSIEIRKPQIEQNHVWPDVGHCLQTLTTRFGMMNGVARSLQGDTEQTPNLNLVVNDERCGLHSGSRNSPPIGSSNTKRAPPAGRFSAVSVPAWASARWRAIESPSPTPPAGEREERKNFSKTRSSVPGSSPCPRSAISNRTASPISPTTSVEGSWDEPCTTALSINVASACMIRPGSTRIGGRSAATSSCKESGTRAISRASRASSPGSHHSSTGLSMPDSIRVASRREIRRASC